MSLLSSGDGRFFGQKPGSSKIKSSLASSNHADPEWSTVNCKRNSKLFGATTNNLKVNERTNFAEFTALNTSNIVHFPFDNSTITDLDVTLTNNNCAYITRLLKTRKKNAWKQFCSILNPSSYITSIWDTAKRFRNCIQPHTRPYNDDF